MAVLGVGRGGSTLAMALVALPTGSSFPLPEPYHILNEVDKSNPQLYDVC